MGIPLYNIPDIRRFYGKPDPYGSSKVRGFTRFPSLSRLGGLLIAIRWIEGWMDALPWDA